MFLSRNPSSDLIVHNIQILTFNFMVLHFKEAQNSVAEQYERNFDNRHDFPL